MSDTIIREESRILIESVSKHEHAYHTFPFTLFFEGQFESPEKGKDLVLPFTLNDYVTKRDEAVQDHGKPLGKLLDHLIEIPGFVRARISIRQLRLEIYPACSWEEENIDLLVEMALISVYGKGQPEGSFVTRHGSSWDTAVEAQPQDSSE